MTSATCPCVQAPGHSHAAAVWAARQFHNLRPVDCESGKNPRRPRRSSHAGHADRGVATFIPDITNIHGRTVRHGPDWRHAANRRADSGLVARPSGHPAIDISSATQRPTSDTIRLPGLFHAMRRYSAPVRRRRSRAPSTAGPTSPRALMQRCPGPADGRMASLRRMMTAPDGRPCAMGTGRRVRPRPLPPGGRTGHKARDANKAERCRRGLDGCHPRRFFT